MFNMEKTWVPENLEKILDNHMKWLNDPETGQRADFSYADLRSFKDLFSDLEDVSLDYINFKHACLEKLWFPSTISMTYCNFQNALLNRTKLMGVDLSYSNFYKTSLGHANLKEARLPVCNFKYADMDGLIGNGHEIQSFNINGTSFVYTNDELQIGTVGRKKFSHWWDFVADENPGIDMFNLYVNVDHRFQDWLKDKMPIIRACFETMPAKKRWFPLRNSDIDEQLERIIKDIPIVSGYHDMHEFLLPRKST